LYHNTAAGMNPFSSFMWGQKVTYRLEGGVPKEEGNNDGHMERAAAIFAI
jgi:hypothetical protein